MHFDWLRSRGVEVPPEGSSLETGVDFGLPLEFDTSIVKPSWPEQLQEWFETEAAYRMRAEVCFGRPWVGFVWPGSAYDMFDDVTEPDESFDFETGGEPVVPISIAANEHFVLAVESYGPRAGWVYGLETETALGGPVAGSLDDYFRAVRELTDLGYLPTATRADDPLDEYSERTIFPPRDTPAMLLWLEIGSVGDFLDLNGPKPPARSLPDPDSSITDLLPWFQVPGL